MRLDTTLLAGYSIQNLRDAVANVITDDIAHKESSEQNTYNRIDEVEPVGTGDGEVLCQQILNSADEPFQQETGQGGENADSQSQQQHELLVRDMAGTPEEDVIERGYCHYLIADFADYTVSIISTFLERDLFFSNWFDSCV